MTSVCLFDEDDESYKGHRLSDEQQQIVETVCQFKNSQVIAKAGTGKTTTCISVGRELSLRHRLDTLLLTYNSSLKDETRVRIRQQGLSSCMQAHSYHAAAYKFFPSSPSSSGADDALIRNAMDHKSREPLRFGLLIIDEAQDMTDLYYQFVRHLLQQFQTPPVLLLLGDPFQQIFRYAGADVRFLTQPEKHFSDLIRQTPFCQLHLRTSYRITHEMAQFINESLNPSHLRHALDPEQWEKYRDLVLAWWGDGIRANPDRPPAPQSVIYRAVAFENGPELQSEVEEVVKHCEGQGSKGREQLAFLSKEMAGRAPMNQVVERLSRQAHENCIVLQGDAHHDLSRPTRSQVMKQKLTFSTIHKFKGLERPVIVVCGMDHLAEVRRSPRDFWEHMDLFNIYYVACTRAQNQLIVWKTQGAFDYVTKRQGPSGVIHQPTRFPCRVKDLLTYVPFDDILSRVGHGIETQKRDMGPVEDSLFCISLDAQDRLIQGRVPGTKEDISPILGLFIELLILRDCQRPLPQYTYHQVLSAFQNSPESAEEVYSFIHTLYQKEPECDVKDLARLSIALFAIQSRFIHVWRQVDATVFYQWVEDHDCLVQGCVDNVRNVLCHLLPGTVPEWSSLAPHLQFFQNIKHDYQHSWFMERFCPWIGGQIDILLDNGLLIELKVSSGLQMDHLLQAQTYASLLFLNQSQTITTPLVLIANLGEVHEVQLTLPSSVPHVSVHEEFIYRLTRRKLSLPFDAAEMQATLSTSKVSRKRPRVNK